MKLLKNISGFELSTLLGIIIGSIILFGMHYYAIYQASNEDKYLTKAKRWGPLIAVILIDIASILLWMFFNKKDRQYKTISTKEYASRFNKYRKLATKNKPKITLDQLPIDFYYSHRTLPKQSRFSLRKLQKSLKRPSKVPKVSLAQALM